MDGSGRLRRFRDLADDTADHIRLDVRQAQLPAGHQPCTLIVIDAVERIAMGEMPGDKQ